MKCLSALLFLGLLGFGGNAFACEGNLIALRNLVKNGNKIGELQVYWNPATGRNCARTMHGGSTWGQQLFTEVFLSTCPRNRRNECGWQSNYVMDRGWYYYQAGPVSRNGANRCWSAAGGITINGLYYSHSAEGC